MKILFECIMMITCNHVRLRKTFMGYPVYGGSFVAACVILGAIGIMALMPVFSISM